ncbi:MAG: M24 family metallopeptidase [Anaerolineae bacterium]
MLFNKTRAIEYMRRCDLDVLVATSPVNILYFADYVCWADAVLKEYMVVPGGSSNLAERFAVFPLEGEPALIVRPLFAVNAVNSWVRDIHGFGDPEVDLSLPSGELSEEEHRLLDLFYKSRGDSRAIDALVRVLRERGLTEARIGLEMEGLAAEAKAAIAAALPRASIGDCTNLIRLIRMVKSPEEIARLSRASEISELASMESLTMAYPGRLISDLVSYYRVRVAEMGADFEHFAFGIRGMGIAASPEYVLTNNDVLWVDFGSTYRHYISDSGTTLAICELPSILSKPLAALQDSLAAGVDMMGPGIRASSVSSAMRDILKACGIKNATAHGHGLGLEERDYPIIVADNGLRIRDDCTDVPSDLPLEEDMVLNLEVSLFMPSRGSLHIEQSFIVTAKGSRPLILQDRTRPFSR